MDVQEQAVLSNTARPCVGILKGGDLRSVEVLHPFLNTKRSVWIYPLRSHRTSQVLPLRRALGTSPRLGPRLNRRPIGLRRLGRAEAEVSDGGLGVTDVLEGVSLGPSIV